MIRTTCSVSFWTWCCLLSKPSPCSDGMFTLLLTFPRHFGGCCSSCEEYLPCYFGGIVKGVGQVLWSSFLSVDLCYLYGPDLVQMTTSRTQRFVFLLQATPGISSKAWSQGTGSLYSASPLGRLLRQSTCRHAVCPQISKSSSWYFQLFIKFCFYLQLKFVSLICKLLMAVYFFPCMTIRALDLMKMIHRQLSCWISKFESGEEGNPTTYNC